MRINDKNGLTLIELVIVLLIMGIMAAIAAPNFLSLRSNMRLKAAARDLYSNMQKARIMAVKTNRNTAIVFDTANNKYELCDNWDSTATPSCIGGKQTVDFSSMKSGVVYGYGSNNVPATKQANSNNDPFPLSPDDNVSYSSPDNTAVFNSQGLGNAGYVYLDHQDDTTTYAIGSTSSGVIKLLKWKGSKWK